MVPYITESRTKTFTSKTYTRINHQPLQVGILLLCSVVVGVEFFICFNYCSVFVVVVWGRGGWYFIVCYCSILCGVILVLVLLYSNLRHFYFCNL